MKNIKNPFKRQKHAVETREYTLGDVLLQAIIKGGDISREQALNIPALASCVELISGTIALIPIKLYSKQNGQLVEVKDDYRLKLLNNYTGDLLSPYNMKKQAIKDYLLDGAGYIYLHRNLNKIISLNYVKRSAISFSSNLDPIFKRIDIFCNGQRYDEWNWLKITKNTTDGVQGTGIVQENNLLLSVCYYSLFYENVLNKTGGNKHVFLTADRNLTPAQITEIKKAWQDLYSGNTDNTVILNNGVKAEQMSSTPTELQMNENKKQNSNEICKIVNVPPSLISGDTSPSDDDYNLLVKLCYYPILSNLISSLNRDLLLNSEQDSYTFGFTTDEIMKATMRDRFEAYKTALDSGVFMLDEVRQMENIVPLGMNYIKLGQDAVLFDPKTKKAFIANLGTTTDISKTSNSVNTSTSQEGGD